MMLTWLVREAKQTCHCGSLSLSSAKTRAYLLVQVTWLEAHPTFTWRETSAWAAQAMSVP